MVYVGLVAFTVFGFAKVPGGFVPTQDKQYLVAFAQLPDAATLDRTEAVIKRMTEIGLQQPGVASAVQFPGLSINGFVNSPNAGIVFFPYEAVRGTPHQGDLRSGDRRRAPNQKFAVIQDAFVAVFPPPPVSGLGTVGGVQARVGGSGRSWGGGTVPRRPRRCLAEPIRRPSWRGCFSSYQINVPQLDAKVDREKVKREGFPSPTCSRPCRSILARSTSNDFNRFGRTYQVIVQADAQYRATAENIGQLKVRNAHGEMVPLGSVLQVMQSHGPEPRVALTTPTLPPTSMVVPRPGSAPAKPRPSWSGWPRRHYPTASGSSGPT